ncbi:MAG: Ig-like domain-containing protein [Planctomycetota bacterium]
MGKRKVIITTLMVALCFLAGLTMIACGGGGGGSSGSSATDVTPPTVSSTVPVNNATNVGITSNLAVTFSEAMLASTITNTTFTVTGTGAAVAGVITYTGVTATFDPTASFAYSTVYTATITTGAKDAASNAMTATYVWAFTTGAAPDTTPPTVASVTPLSGSATAAINTSIQITFSEAMLVSSISSTTITLANTGAVTATVSYAGVTATLTPISNMAYSTLYTVTVVGGTNGVKDLASNAMTPTYTYTFTTAAAPTPADSIAPLVNFTYPLTGTTTLALNSAIIATFSEAISAGTINTATFTLARQSTGASVPANVTYNGVQAILRPTNNLLASTVYTASLTSGIKDLAGNAKVPYVWTFTTGTASNVAAPTVAVTTPTTNAPINTRFYATFSTPVDAATVTVNTFTVKVSSTAVAGTVVYNGGLSAVFIPTSALAVTATGVVTISGTTTGLLGTGVKDICGNLLGADITPAFNTTALSDTTLPLTTTGATTVTAVVIGNAIDVVFNKAMLPSTLNTLTFTLTKAGVPVTGTVTVGASTTASFKPVMPLTTSTVYVATINGATDLQGNALSPTPSSWTLTTQDLIAPTVVSTLPVNGATNWATNGIITVNFSEAVNAATLAAGNFTLKQNNANVIGTQTLAYTAGTTQATLQPGTALTAGLEYVATLSGVTDVAGNAMSVSNSPVTTANPQITYVWRFTVATANAAPVAYVSPIAGATAGVNTKVVAFFSEPMLASTITSASFYVDTAASGAVTVDTNGLWAMFTPTYNLAAGSHTATITTTVSNANSVALAANYVWTFSVAGSDDVAPLVSYVAPLTATTTAGINTSVIAMFSEMMNPTTINTSTFTLIGGTYALSSTVTGAVTYFGTTARFTPTAALTASTAYTATITTGVADVAGSGNPMAANYSWTFTTAAAEDFGAPALHTTATYLPGTAVANSRLPFFFAVGDELIPSSVNAASVTLIKAGTTAIAGTVTTNGRFVTFAPAAALTAGQSDYVVTIKGTVKDMAGNELLVNYDTYNLGTIAAADAVAPTATVASSGTTPNVIFTATFSEAMDPTTINTGTFIVRLTASPYTRVIGTVSYGVASGTTAVFTPLVPMATATGYTGYITTGAKDLAGNALATAPSSIVLSGGTTSATFAQVGTGVAAGATDTNGRIGTWSAGKQIKFTVTDVGCSTSTITLNGNGATTPAAYVSAADITYSAAGTMVFVVTTTDALGVATTRTFSMPAHLAAVSADATITTASTVKGTTVIGIGIPHATTIATITAGTINITAAKAADTSEATTFITAFIPTLTDATLLRYKKVVKYATADTATEANVLTLAAYAGGAITTGDYFIIKVIAEDGTTTLFYRITVTIVG